MNDMSTHPGQTGQSRARLRTRSTRAALLTLPVLGAAALGAIFYHPASAPAAPTPPVVTVAHPLVRTVDQWDDYVGRFAASQAVEVRPRVSGAVTAIHFRDGEMVRKGQLLFTIDPRPYAAALAEAKAGVATATSALALARSDYERAARLQGDDAVSASEIDSLRARVRSAEAALAAAQARAQARALDVGFTQVHAPIAGRISDRRVDIGNLVAAGDGGNATLLTTINALDPIYFGFDASEALYLKARHDRHADGAIVEVRLQDETAYRWTGKLDFTDNGIDPRSGTVRGRATIANPDLALTPGLFGNMRMASGRAPALLVPDEAVQTDQADKAVLVVGPGGILASRKVVLGPSVDGLRVIASGLAPTDRVVIAGNALVAAGTKTTMQDGTIRPHADAAHAVFDPIPAAEATLAAH